MTHAIIRSLKIEMKLAKTYVEYNKKAIFLMDKR